MPVILGYVKQIFPPLAGEATLTFTLISRRSSCQAGTRYWTRGCDLDGNAANWVLTEQVIEHQADICSYVQVREIPFGAAFTPPLVYPVSGQRAVALDTDA